MVFEFSSEELFQSGNSLVRCLLVSRNTILNTKMFFHTMISVHLNKIPFWKWYSVVRSFLKPNLLANAFHLFAIVLSCLLVSFDGIVTSHNHIYVFQTQNGKETDKITLWSKRTGHVKESKYIANIKNEREIEINRWIEKNGKESVTDNYML